MHVVGGKTKRTFSDSPTEVREETCGCVVEVDDESLIGAVDDAMCGDLFEIADFISENVSACYSAPVRHVHLFFGLTDRCPVLLRTSTVAMRVAEPDPTEQAEISRAIGAELDNFPLCPSVCCTNGAMCRRPKYKLAKLSVLLYRLGRRFPRADERVLHSMIKNRMADLSEETVCCVTCYHVYAAADRIFQCARRPLPLTFELPPAPFQHLTAQERNKRDKRAIDSTVAAAGAPHRFVLNLVDSPYSRSSTAPAEPPKPARSRTRSAAPVPGWARRLLDSDRDDRPRSAAGRSAAAFPALPAIGPMPVFVSAVGHSQQLAPRSYGAPPFDIRKLDPKRKRGLHRSMEEHFSRLNVL
jgi:hypothetical protein